MIWQVEQHFPLSIVSMTSLALKECRRSTAGWALWRLFVVLCGWRVLDAKSTPPAQVLAVFGVEFDLRPLPHQQMIIKITELRLQVRSTTLCEILKSTTWNLLLLMVGSMARKIG